jgi:hypothetical protein
MAQAMTSPILLVLTVSCFQWPDCVMVLNGARQDERTKVSKLAATDFI